MSLCNSLTLNSSPCHCGYGWRVPPLKTTALVSKNRQITLLSNRVIKHCGGGQMLVKGSRMGQFSRVGGAIPRALSKDVKTGFRYPEMTERPRWWWRTVACLPYLMPLHETWMYAQTAYHLHHFLEFFEFMTYPFLRAVGRLPSWFMMAYFFTAYLGVVRRKEWPHFVRFHMVSGMLLEILLQTVGTVSRWLPQALYWGKIGMHFWTAFAFSFLFTVLECIRCALRGMYADVPFVCDAAYIQIPYD